MEADGDARDPVTVEVRGLAVYTHHGVTDAEQEVGQWLELDIALELASAEAVETDDLAGTVDYAEVADLAAAVATGTRYRTLERLAGVLGERLVESFNVAAATVRAAKPEPPMPHTVGSAGVTVTTRRGG